jgi:hypothetical protein
MINASDQPQSAQSAQRKTFWFLHKPPPRVVLALPKKTLRALRALRLI